MSADSQRVFPVDDFVKEELYPGYRQAFGSQPFVAGPVRPFSLADNERYWLRDSLHFSEGMVPLLQPELASGTCILVAETCSREQRQRLADYGTQVISVAIGADGQVDLQSALQALARRDIMHVLMEGGAKMLGSAFDQHCIDHVAAFIAPKLIGGCNAPSPVEGRGLPVMAHASPLRDVHTSAFDGDVLVEGNVVYR